MSWECKKLGDIIEIKKGTYITKKESKEGPYPVILGGQEPAYYIDTFNHTGKAIVVSRSGASAGYVSFWNEPIFVTDGFLIEPKNNINVDFLYYLVKSHQAELQGKQGGAAIPHVNPRIINAIQVMVPNIELQERIVDILSAYDDLIENNQKQIKLLEEAAQRLYKEWFVDLRFPGYENTPITDGVPQGWKQESIDNVYSIKYGKNLPTTEISTNGKYPVYGANGVIGYYDKYNCDAYVTLVTSRGNGSGDVSRTHHSNSFVTNNSFVVIPQQAYDFISNEFTYWLMKHTDFKSICTGSAQPQLTNNSISTLKVLVPTKKLILHFCETTRTYFENVESLLKQNRLLTEARDRLLPKLMSGELEV